MMLMLKVGSWDDICGKRWDVLKAQKLSLGVKGCVFVCALKGGGDIAYMADVTGPGLTEGHKKGCIASVA